MYIVRSLALTNWLCGKGYKILKADDSEKDAKFKVFLFADSEELRNSVDNYLSNKKGGIKTGKKQQKQKF